MLFGELEEGMLSVELAKVEGGWLWRNDMTGSRPNLGLGCLNRLVVETTNGRMESIVGGREPIAWCGSLPVVLIAVEAAWSRAPFSF
jgi:hypothetical protein